jgi:uncharacterized protein
MSEVQATSGALAPPEFQVRLSGDRLRLYVSAPYPRADLAGTAARLARELPALELAVEVGADVLAELLSRACAPGEHLLDFPLLTGDPPAPPRDGAVEWQDDYFAEGFALDEQTGKVDYWERAERRAVSAGQLVAIVLLPQEGRPGRTLQGDEVPVPKPSAFRLRAGKGIRTEEEDGRVLYRAAQAGRLNLKDGTLTIDEVYLIRGDVGLATGNIRHTGTLVVQGDVKENARIECDGDILIKGLVEPADIVCGGDLTVGGGIVGDRARRLEVAGEVQARYLNDVNLRCGGDVAITSQIDHSQVECGGKVVVARGRIAGSAVKAYRGIRVDTAGARGASGTVLVPGACWRFEQRSQERRERLLKLQTARDKLQRTVSQVLLLGTRDAAHDRVIAQLKGKIEQVDRALKQEVAAQDRDAEETSRGAVREVAIFSQLHAGVTFRIGAAQATSDRTYDSPRLVALRRDRVHILPMGEHNTPR